MFICLWERDRESAVVNQRITATLDFVWIRAADTVNKIIFRWFWQKIRFVKWFTISDNDYFCITVFNFTEKLLKLLKSRWFHICWGLYKTNSFSLIWRTGFVGQGVSAALQYYIITVASVIWMLHFYDWFSSYSD